MNDWIVVNGSILYIYKRKVGTTHCCSPLCMSIHPKSNLQYPPLSCSKCILNALGMFVSIIFLFYFSTNKLSKANGKYWLNICTKYKYSLLVLPNYARNSFFLVHVVIYPCHVLVFIFLNISCRPYFLFALRVLVAPVVAIMRIANKSRKN